MNNLKKIIFKILGSNGKKKLVLAYRTYRSNAKLSYKIKYILKCIFSCKVIKMKDYQGLQLKKMYEKVNIRIDNNEIFAYSIDFFKILETKNSLSFGNLTVDYDYILDKSIKDLKKEYSKKTEYNTNILYLLDGIELMATRMIEAINASNIKNKKKLEESFKKIINGKIDTSFDAIQKILFYNQLLWQSDLNLIGIGRLDKILINYYKKDLKSKRITSSEMKKYLKSFCRLLHKYFYEKSGTLIGDTGQIIILGGTTKEGKHYNNELTYMIMEVLMELCLPDPKILLRVNDNLPKNLLDLSLKSICHGLGSPLMANDNVIIPKLNSFGWKDDSIDYVTSACWEPFLVGKSSDQNNMLSINYIIPFNEMLNNENLQNLKDISSILNIYKKYLDKYLDEVLLRLDSINFNNNCLLSLFYENCKLEQKDIGEGGAKYNNYGITSVAMSSVVNSIINIDNLSFKKKKYSLIELNEIRKNNFNNDDLLKELKNNKIVYGIDDKNVISITNSIMKQTNDKLKKYHNKYNCSVKFGLSSPSYIIESKATAASLDGRKNGEPFNVHISSSKAGYTELFNFAKNINYNELGFNGNVLDFMVSPSFIKSNYEKFSEFMKLAIHNGFFEMQMNVIDSKTLIEAKKNPNKFPNLIVRVWGFSTYFNELPTEYKDLLIKRAIDNENNGY